MSRCVFRTIEPPSRINSNMILDQQQWQILTNNSDMFKQKSYQDQRITGSPNDRQTRWGSKFFKQALIFVITETVGEYPYPYLTEKTWKAIIYGRPFMIVGAKHSIATLQNFGFKTFDNWWSEAYDNLDTVADRIQFIVQELKNMKNLSTDDLQKMYVEMIPTLKHNQENFRYFVQNDLNHVRNSL